MLDFRDMVEWAMALVALVATGALLYRGIGLVPRGRLLRCPDTGRKVFVEMGLASPGDGSKPKLTVQSCELWPRQYECAGRCRAGQKWAAWPKWGQCPISEAGAKDKTSVIPLEACI